MSPRVQGHALRFEGRVMKDGYGPGNGEGRGGCECGARSPSLPNTAARQKWHRDHKQEVMKASG